MKNRTRRVARARLFLSAIFATILTGLSPVANAEDNDPGVTAWIALDEGRLDEALVTLRNAEQGGCHG